MKRYALIALLLVLVTASSTFASTSLPQGTSFGDGDSPLSRSVAATLAAPEADDSHFVADSGGDLDLYLFRTDPAVEPDGRLRFNIPITRYYFNSNDIDSDDFDSSGFLTDDAVRRAVSNRTLPETALLRLRVYDVDEDAAWCPEVDLLYVNDQPIYANEQHAKLSGANETWSSPSFRIPIGVLKFPTSRGENAAPTPVENEIAIRIDARNCTTSEGDPAWAVQVDWGEIEIASPIRPIVFAHGWTGSTESFSYIEDKLAEDGIPSAGHADLLEGIYPIPQTSGWLAGHMYDALQEFGVDKINLFAHSKGGLVSRQTLRLSVPAEHTEHLVTFASPHHGTLWAENTTLMSQICSIKYPFDFAKAALCYVATQEFRRDTIREGFNYTGCTYEWWPLPPHWEGCEPLYVKQSEVGYFSLAANLDEAVRPLASTTYPWLADDIPFPDSINVDGRFNTLHGGILDSDSAYKCAMHLLDGNLYSCPASDVRSASSSGTVPQQVILIETGSLAADGHYSTFASVDGGSELVFESYGNHAFAFTLVEPGGRVIDPGMAGSDPDITFEAHDDGLLWLYRYHLTNPVTGDWEISVQTESALTFALWGLTNSENKLRVKTDRFTYRPAESVTVETALTENDVPATGVAFTGQVTHPDETTEPLAFLDDGSGPDAQAGDGIYTSQFTASTTNGYSTIEVEASKGSVERRYTAVAAVASQTAALQGILYETPVDTNANSLYDRLDITADVQILQTGHFDVQASLIDAHGQMITTAYYSTRQSGDDPWPVGNYPIVLGFDGKAIAQHGIDGPYTLSTLFIFDTSSYRLEVYQAEDVYTTSAYLASQFERPLIMLAGGNETVLDLDGNGRYDLLTISLLIDIALAGDYEVNGRLADPEGGEITWATASFSAPGSGTYQVDLVFDGYAIGTHQIDGPYSLYDLSVFNATGAGSDTFTNAFTTQAYPFTAFEGGFYRVYLPVVFRNYGREPGPDSLYGHVTDSGIPVAGTQVQLRYYDGSSWSTYDVAYTDLDGNYALSDPPVLNVDQSMYVLWSNSGDPGRLSRWACWGLTYVSGPDARECNFDLDNIDLVSPSHSSLVSVPATFTWNKRAITTDNYELNLAEMGDYDPYWRTQVGYVDSFAMTSLPSGFVPDLPYGWWMWVYGPDGYGISHYYYIVTFLNSVRSAEIQAVPASRHLWEEGIEMMVPQQGP